MRKIIPTFILASALLLTSCGDKLTKIESDETLDNGTNVVMFSATWCGACKRQHPKLEELSEALPEVNFFLIDVDESKDLSTKYKIEYLPTTLVFKDGKVIKTYVGVMTDYQLSELETLLKIM